MTEFVVLKNRRLSDGRHEGKIIGVKYRTTPYKYTDYELASEGAVVKAGFPSTMYEDGKHADMLRGFGVVVAEGLKVEPECLIGRDCEFITVTSGKFANVVAESLKPLGVFIRPGTLAAEERAKLQETREVRINGGSQKQGSIEEQRAQQAAGAQPQAQRAKQYSG